MAERVGVEPTSPVLPGYPLSRRALSATQTPLRPSLYRTGSQTINRAGRHRPQRARICKQLRHAGGSEMAGFDFVRRVWHMVRRRSRDAAPRQCFSGHRRQRRAPREGMEHQQELGKAVQVGLIHLTELFEFQLAGRSAIRQTAIHEKSLDLEQIGRRQAIMRECDQGGRAGPERDRRRRGGKWQR